MELNKIYNENCLSTLAKMPDNFIDCCVTSPPYYGLRDYGHKDQIGLEETPELYVQKLVEVFRDVKRVLKSDGTLFLNLGDSYWGSGKGGNPEGSKWSGFVGNKKREKSAMPLLNASVRRATSCDTYDIKPEDYPKNDYISESLCDVCRQVCLHISHNDSLLSSMLIASLSLPTHEHREFVNDHFPTSDFYHQVNHILSSIGDFLHSANLSFEHLISFRQSMPTEFYRLLLDECLRRGSSSSCLLCGRSLISYENPNGNKLGEFLKTLNYNQGNALPCDQQENHNQYINKDGGCYDEIYSYYTHIKPQCTHNNHTNLKPKDLIGIPWLVAFALRADGWYLRDDIIWFKPNPMPESVTDRCTKSYEHIFLLTKSAKYYYDADSIKCPVVDTTILRMSQQIEKQKGSDRVPGKTNGTMKAVGPGRKPRPDDNRAGNQGSEKGIPAMAINGNGVNGHSGYFDSCGNLIGEGMANKKNVWVVPTMPFKEAHFATFPEDLIIPCIKAGSRVGGIVYDPFSGAGTTALVSHKLNRKFVGSEINPEYVEIAEKRIKPFLMQQKFQFD